MSWYKRFECLSAHGAGTFKVQCTADEQARLNLQLYFVIDSWPERLRVDFMDNYMLRRDGLFPSVEDRSAAARPLTRLVVHAPPAAYDRIVGVADELFHNFSRTALFIEGRNGGDRMLFPFTLMSRGAAAALAAALGDAAVKICAPFLLPHSYASIAGNRDGPDLITHVALDDGDVIDLDCLNRAVNYASLKEALGAAAGDLLFALPNPAQLAARHHVKLRAPNPLASQIDRPTRYVFHQDCRLFEEYGNTLLATHESELHFNNARGEFCRWVFMSPKSTNETVLEFCGDRFSRMTTSLGLRRARADETRFVVVPPRPVANTASDQVAGDVGYAVGAGQVDGHLRIDGHPFGVMNPTTEDIDRASAVPGASIYLHEAGSYLRTFVIAFKSPMLMLEHNFNSFMEFALGGGFFRLAPPLLPRDPASEAFFRDDVDRTFFDDVSNADWVTLVTHLVVDESHWRALQAAASDFKFKMCTGDDRAFDVRVTDRIPVVDTTRGFRLNLTMYRHRLVLQGEYPPTPPSSWCLTALARILFNADYWDPARPYYVTQHYFQCTGFSVYHKGGGESRRCLVYDWSAEHQVDGVRESFGLTGDGSQWTSAAIHVPPRSLGRQIAGSSGLLQFLVGQQVRSLDPESSNVKGELQAALADVDNLEVEYGATTTGDRFPALTLPPLAAARFPQRRPPFDDLKRNVTLIRGHCGAGKSTAMGTLLTSLGADDRFIFITPRVAVVVQEMWKARERAGVNAASLIAGYKDRRPFAATVRALFTTLHSLPKFVGSNLFFDTDAVVRPPHRVVVVFDEFCTALFADMQSRSVLPVPEIERALGELLTLVATDIYLLDAYDAPVVAANLIKRIPNHAVRRWAAVDFPQRVAVSVVWATHNIVKEQRRVAHVYCSHRAREELTSRLGLDHLAQGGRVAAFFSSRNELDYMKLALMELGEIEESKVLVFTSKSRLDTSSLCDDIVNNDIRLFLYTTAAGSGVDITILNAAGDHYFDAVALYGVDTSTYLDVLSIYQGSMRVRHCPALYVALRDRPLGPFSLASLQAWRWMMRSSLREIVDKMCESVVHLDAIVKLQQPDAAVARALSGVLGLPLARLADTGVYSETMVFGWLQRHTGDFRSTLIVSFLSNLGYDIRMHSVSEVDRDEAKATDEIVETSRLRQFCLRQFSPPDDFVLRRTRPIKVELGIPVEPAFQVNMLEEFVDQRGGALRRAMPILFCYHMMALKRPQTLADWRSLLQTLAERTLSTSELGRSMQEMTDRSQNSLPMTAEITYRSMHSYFGAIYYALCLYAAASLANMREPGFFRPVAPQKERSDDANEEMMPNPLILKTSGEFAMVRVARVRAYLDEMTSGDGELKVRNGRRQGKSLSRHLQQLTFALLGESFDCKRGVIKNSAGTRLAVIFGIYSRYARTHFGDLISNDEMNELDAAYDGIGQVERAYAEFFDTVPRAPVARRRREIRRQEFIGANGIEVRDVEVEVDVEVIGERRRRTAEDLMKTHMPGDPPAITAAKKAFIGEERE